MIRSIALVLALTTPALGDVKAPGGKTIDCFCTDKAGARIELGETICLQVDGRMFMAQCQMSLNVPMWREVQKGCLSSSLNSGQQPLQSFSIYPHI
ncbi:hypothetical protein [Pseudosulfitobacter koreensis]|uniref:Uncharacterized protein n=1 Tax=Pseudosulfitobacter koreensis TaxID=2968472 RepID=A0ABT1Z0S4_9RHOB|nr:hypothetical protein [Pseudosulfitobacter koreense]MCR8826736.1 hypothetical protein [Pseudosulfitobacter koreense]